MGLYDYYKEKGGTLGATAEDRFKDPAFASAAKSAGYDANSYKVNMGNAKANTDIERYLRNPVNQGMNTGATGTNTNDSGISSGANETIGSAFNFSNPATTGYENDPIYKQYQENQAKLARGESIVDQEAIRKTKNVRSSR